MSNLFIIRGVSGSGKSTLVQEALYNLPHFEADMYFRNNGEYVFDPSKLKKAHEWCLNQVENCMIDKMNFDECDIVVSNTFTTEWEMKPYIDLADKYGYTVFTIVVENRHGNKDIHNVPDETRKKQAERLSKSIKLI